MRSLCVRDVDAVAPDGAHEVGVPVDDLVGSEGAHRRGLRCAGDGDDTGAAALGQLDSGRPDSARGTGHQHAFVAYRGPLEQILGRGVRARDGSQLSVGPVAVDLVRLARGRLGVLGERAVTFRAEGPALERAVADGLRNRVRTIARSPRRFGSTPSPTATIRPQQSAPWIRGKVSGTSDQPAADTSVSLAPSAAPAALPAVFEYHPMRVLMSVLLTLAAATRRSTSPAPATGVGTSSR